MVAAALALLAPSVLAQVPVVASFSILADMAQVVGGARVRVHTVVGIGADPHVYRPTPLDLRAVAGARLIVVNGAGFEGWMRRLVAASGTSAEVVEATAGLDLRERTEIAAHGADGHHAPSHAGADPQPKAVDPHAWHDPRLARGYVRNIAAALIRVDPPAAAAYRERAERYLQAIDARFERLRQAVAAVPARHREVLAPHDGFAYMNAAYGLSILPLAVTSGHQTPSAARLAHLLRELERGDVRSIFSERQVPSRFVTALGRESGVPIAGRLYADSLSPADGPAATYLAFMTHNVTTILSALSAEHEPGGRQGR